jgi:hypothetical protein
MSVYGCHNRAVRIEHTHVMSKDCQYTRSQLGQADPKCNGCKHKITTSE